MTGKRLTAPAAAAILFLLLVFLDRHMETSVSATWRLPLVFLIGSLVFASGLLIFVIVETFLQTRKGRG